MDPKIITITPDQHSKRLDALCAAMFPIFSRSAWQARGVFLLDGVEKSYKTKAKTGEKWTVSCEEKPPMDNVEPWDFPLKVLDEGEEWVVIEKPYGISMHPSPSDPGQKTIVNALLHQFSAKNLAKNTETIDGKVIERPGLVHRLDKTTSGVILVAKTAQAHKFFQDNWKDVEKIYHAITFGKPNPSGTIQSPIGRSPKNRQKMACVAGGKPSVTHFQVLESKKGYAQLEVKLETGRTHQIRVHLSAIGCPIVGDVLYDGQKAERVLLHAQTLQFTTPDGEKKEVTSALPPVFAEFWGSLDKL